MVDSSFALSSFALDLVSMTSYLYTLYSYKPQNATVSMRTRHKVSTTSLLTPQMLTFHHISIHPSPYPNTENHLISSPQIPWSNNRILEPPHALGSLPPIELDSRTGPDFESPPSCTRLLSDPVSEVSAYFFKSASATLSSALWCVEARLTLSRSHSQQCLNLPYQHIKYLETRCITDSGLSLASFHRLDSTHNRCPDCSPCLRISAPLDAEKSRKASVMMAAMGAWALQ